MQLNKLFFPSSKPTYTKVSISLLPNVELLQIQSGNSEQCFRCSVPQNRQVPVLLVKHENFLDDLNNKYIMFFHSNSEDIYNCYEYLYPIISTFNVNLILVEYPSYGIYQNQSASADIISEDAIAVYQYFINKRRIKKENIILMGRSMGCGPACLLASQFNPAALITISGYTSLKEVAQSFIGSVLAKLIDQKFDNLKIISNVTCPMLVIHGQKDQFITCDHSKRLISQTKSKIKQYHLSENMTHNDFSIQDDIIQPLRNLFEKINFIQIPQQLPKEQNPLGIIVLRKQHSKKQTNLIL
ncbi:unnamed protein product [Paramecium primaurelia]|uniref:Serine hydrolase domain-containing protein n=1 Tax=Paramecium primaurelia TaxID=5886 RepID=A0A8S1PJ69_PARPR|nr:unnamed protein product [Paramecium primaurelia]